MADNIVIVVPDHFRGEALGHMGNPAVLTPNLDRLAEEGVSFRNAFCQNPICTPSRCSFMSGLYPHVRGHRTISHLMKQDEPVLLRNLKDAGYFVWWGGKNDLVAGDIPLDAYCDVRCNGTISGLDKPAERSCSPDAPWRGGSDSDKFYSFYIGELDKGNRDFYPDSDWADVMAAVDFIKDPLREPYCLYLALNYPHLPFAVEAPWFGMTDRSRLPDRAPVPEDWSGKPAMLRGIAERGRLNNWSKEQLDELHGTFYDMCSRVDHQFGLLMDALRESGQYDDTAVFFFSDHSCYAGDFGAVSVSQNTFEDILTRVPLLIKPPARVEVKHGIKDALVELIDVPATVFDLLGIVPDHYHFGRSLLPLISGETDVHRDAVFCEGGRLQNETHCKELEYEEGQDPANVYWPRLSLQASDGPEHTKAIMCRTECYKYVYRLYEEDELYDLKADHLEMTNSINDPGLADVRNQLKERVLRFLVETVDTVPLHPDKR